MISIYSCRILEKLDQKNSQEKLPKSRTKDNSKTFHQISIRRNKGYLFRPYNFFKMGIGRPEGALVELDNLNVLSFFYYYYYFF